MRVHYLQLRPRTTKRVQATCTLAEELAQLRTDTGAREVTATGATSAINPDDDVAIALSLIHI